MAEPTLHGELEPGGAIELLRDVETARVTGVLEFEDEEGVKGEITLVAGQIAVDQTPTANGVDPVDALLDAGKTTYRVFQKLPALPVSGGDDLERTGSLGVHVVADLMKYCEQASLTGALELTRGECSAEIVYQGGELIAIELAGDDNADLQDVFAWDEGRFRISIDLDAPSRVEEKPDDTENEWDPVPARKGEATQQFLRVVQVALTDVVDDSEKARARTRTKSSPPLPPPPKARPRMDTLPPPAMPRRKRGDQTVRLIYRKDEPSVPPPGPRHTNPAKPPSHVSKHDREKTATKPQTSPPVAARRIWAELGWSALWILVFLGLSIAVLAVMAQLPPVEPDRCDEAGEGCCPGRVCMEGLSCAEYGVCEEPQ